MKWTPISWNSTLLVNIFNRTSNVNMINFIQLDSQIVRQCRKKQFKLQWLNLFFILICGLHSYSGIKTLTWTFVNQKKNPDCSIVRLKYIIASDSTFYKQKYPPLNTFRHEASMYSRIHFNTKEAASPTPF